MRNRRNCVFQLHYDSMTGEPLPEDSLWKPVSPNTDLEEFVRQAEELEGRSLHPEEVHMIRRGTWRSQLDFY